MGFAFKVAAWGTDDHQSSNYFNAQLKGGEKKWDLETIYEPLTHFDSGGVRKED